MNLRKQSCSRYSKKSEHNDFGVYNFLSKKGITVPDDQQEYIELFLIDIRYKGNKDKKSIVSFIQKHFVEFAKLVNNVIKSRNNNPNNK